MDGYSQVTIAADILTLSANEIVELYRARKLSPVDVVRATLAGIEALNPLLNAFCFVAPDALDAAAASERRWMQREPQGALDGVPVSIKGDGRRGAGPRRSIPLVPGTTTPRSSRACARAARFSSERPRRHA